MADKKKSRTMSDALFGGKGSYKGGPSYKKAMERRKRKEEIEQAKKLDKRGYEQYKKDMESKGIEPDSIEDWTASNKKNKTLPSQISKQNIKKTKTEEEQKKREEEQKKKEEEEAAKKAAEERKSSKTEKIEGKISKHTTKNQKKAYEKWLKENKMSGDDETFKQWQESEEGIKASKKKTKRGDRLKEKLAESKMYDDMDIQERMAYKQKKRDQRDKNIRNTIATIDSIIPSSYGGGRGVSSIQDDDDETKKIADKNNFSDTDKDYISEAGKGNDKEGGNIDTTEEDASIVEENPNLVTEEQTNLELQDENKNKEDNTNTDEVNIKTDRYKGDEEMEDGEEEDIGKYDLETPENIG